MVFLQAQGVPIRLRARKHGAPPRAPTRGRMPLQAQPCDEQGLAPCGIDRLIERYSSWMVLRKCPPHPIQSMALKWAEVGDGGRWFSEGQKQRIAMARAILPNPAILLLDEVTSSLDPESEAAVNATIQQLAQQRTVILVTHRLASASFVDHLVVVDEGQIKEQGSHDELLANAGLYQRLWQRQSGFVVSGDGHRAEVQGERLKAIPLFRDMAIDTLNELAT